MLALFRARDVKPAALLEARELQTALSLVPAEAGSAWYRPPSNGCGGTMLSAGR